MHYYCAISNVEWVWDWHAIKTMLTIPHSTTIEALPPQLHNVGKNLHAGMLNMAKKSTYVHDRTEHVKKSY